MKDSKRNNNLDILDNFNSIVDYMGQCINNMFIKIKKSCKYLDTEKRYAVALLDEAGDKVVRDFILFYTEEKGWTAGYPDDYGDLYTYFPSDSYMATIYDMTIDEVYSIFSESHTARIRTLHLVPKVLWEIKF